MPRREPEARNAASYCYLVAGNEKRDARTAALRLEITESHSCAKRS